MKHKNKLFKYFLICLLFFGCSNHATKDEIFPGLTKDNEDDIVNCSYHVYDFETKKRQKYNEGYVLRRYCKSYYSDAGGGPGRYFKVIKIEMVSKMSIYLQQQMEDIDKNYRFE